MQCPQCHFENNSVKDGTYRRPSDCKKVQRYLCRNCGKRFSCQTFRYDFRLRKRRVNQLLFRLLGKGVSQRGCAEVLNIHRSLVDLRVERFGRAAMARIQSYREKREKQDKVKEVLVDEMETFEHTKCKPVTIAIAVENKSRKILCLKAGSIAAKGKLAVISRKKYGVRKCQRNEVLHEVFSMLTRVCDPSILIKSDQSHHYPAKIHEYFPKASHYAFKGRRGCIVGQGELKEGGNDPLFSLNHTYAMIRDNIKRLTRRTWCTTKCIVRLEFLMHIYAWYHNQKLDKLRPVIG